MGGTSSDGHIKTYVHPICLSRREFGSPYPEFNVGSWSNRQALHAGITSSLTPGTLLSLPKWKGGGGGTQAAVCLPWASLQDAEATGDNASAGGLGSRPILQKADCEFPWSLLPW